MTTSELRYGVRISTWRGIVGVAQHYFAEVWRYDERGELPTEYVDLKHKLTADEASKLNRIDRPLLSGIRWRAGMESNRFETREAVIAAAAAALKERWGYTGEFEMGGPEYDDNESLWGERVLGGRA